MTEKNISPKYYLSRGVLRSRATLEITPERAEGLARAWVKLRLVADLEESWDAVVRNYIELEQVLLETALHDMVISGKDFFSFQETRLSFAVKLASLLSSCRAYLDHTPHHLRELEDEPEWGEHKVKVFAQLTNAEYDKRNGYRFMEELRRHAQHRGLPIHGASFASSWVEGGEEGLLSFSASSRIDLDRLRSDKKFKSAALEGFKESNVKVESLVRDYLEGISEIHTQVRREVDLLYGLAKKAIVDALADFRSVSNEEDVFGLRVMESKEGGRDVSRTPLFSELPDYVEHLRRKNRPMVNLSRRFVKSNVDANRPKTVR